MTESTLVYILLFTNIATLATIWLVWHYLDQKLNKFIIQVHDALDELFLSTEDTLRFDQSMNLRMINQIDSNNMIVQILKIKQNKTKTETKP